MPDRSIRSSDLNRCIPVPFSSKQTRHFRKWILFDASMLMLLCCCCPSRLQRTRNPTLRSESKQWIEKANRIIRADHLRIEPREFTRSRQRKRRSGLRGGFAKVMSREVGRLLKPFGKDSRDQISDLWNRMTMVRRSRLRHSLQSAAAGCQRCYALLPPRSSTLPCPQRMAFDALQFGCKVIARSNLAPALVRSLVSNSRHRGVVCSER